MPFCSPGCRSSKPIQVPLHLVSPSSPMVKSCGSVHSDFPLLVVIRTFQ
ncbi:Uncharacterised protein [Segatella copri]|nr:Uncharacterised protein [Segatella copri]